MQKENPCQLDGFAFLEFSAPNPEELHTQFINMGFQKIGTSADKLLSFYQQGKIHFIVNETKNSQAEEHAKIHGAGACAMGFKVKDAKKAQAYVLAQGAKEAKEEKSHKLPAISAIGGSLIYFSDEATHPFLNLKPGELTKETKSLANLAELDHLTHNVYRGQMDKWANFYQELFNFTEIRFFNIQGKMTGLISRALGSPCGKIKIPLNESKDEVSQIEEFLKEYRGEGIQHIALSTPNIYQTVEALKEKGIHFLDVPDTYYEMIEERLPWHSESLENLRKGRILIDGEKDPKHGLLLQIFTENTFGPVFFEIIQRRGNQGFGEGNFQALFEAIERDQIRRGTLKG